MSGSPVHDLLTVSPPNLNLVRCDYETNWNSIGDCLIENEIDALLFAPFCEVIVHLLEEGQLSERLTILIKFDEIQKLPIIAFTPHSYVVFLALVPDILYHLPHHRHC